MKEPGDSLLSRYAHRAVTLEMEHGREPSGAFIQQDDGVRAAHYGR